MVMAWVVKEPVVIPTGNIWSPWETNQLGISNLSETFPILIALLNMLATGLKRLGAQQRAITAQVCDQCLRPTLSTTGARVGRYSTLADGNEPAQIHGLNQQFSHTQRNDRSSNSKRDRIQGNPSASAGNSFTGGVINNNNSNTAKSLPKLPSHKPPKRRLEAASAPLRYAPSPSRGPELQCIAHTTAERYDLANLGLVLRNLGVRWDEVPEGDKDRAFVIGPWKGRGGAERLISGKDVRRTTAHSTSLMGAEEEGRDMEENEENMGNMGFGYGERGEIWVFHSGSFVTWGLTEEEGRAFLREVVRKRGANVEVERLSAKEYEVEEVDFVVDPTA